MDGRMLKLETSLRSLNQQVENLSAALAVSAETAALGAVGAALLNLDAALTK